MPMSRGWVPCGKHATLVCWGLAGGKGEIRVRLLPDGVGCLACRREAVAGPWREEGRRRVFWILELGSLNPNVAPADGEKTHGSQQQERVIKV